MAMSNPDDAEPSEEAERTSDFSDESEMIVAGDEETAKVAGHDGEIRIYVVDDQEDEWVQSDMTVKDMDFDTDSVHADAHDNGEDKN